MEYTRKGRFAEGLAAYNSALEDPELRTGALGCRAWLLRSMGKYQDALVDYDELLPLLPGNEHVRAMRADLLRLMNRADEAVQICMDLLKTNPLCGEALKVLANYQESRGVRPFSEENPAPAAMPWKPVNEVIAELEREPGTFPMSIYPEIGHFLYATVRCLRPRLAVETGSFIGYSTLCIAGALKDGGGGHLHAFDLFNLFEGYVSPVLGHCEDLFQVVSGHLHVAGLSEFATLHKGHSPEGIRELFKYDEASVDFAFIDGDHSISGCVADWKAIEPALAPGAVVMFHDTTPEGTGWMGPRFLLEKLALDPAGYRTMALPSPDTFGLGLVQKLTSEKAIELNPSLAMVIAEALFHKRKRGKYFPPIGC